MRAIFTVSVIIKQYLISVRKVEIKKGGWKGERASAHCTLQSAWAIKDELGFHLLDLIVEQVHDGMAGAMHAGNRHLGDNCIQA